MDAVPGVLKRFKRRRNTNAAVDLSLLHPLSLEEQQAIPEADFVSAEFDRETGTRPSSMIVLLSTPRSGSTYVCDLLHRAGLCTAHEYFQPYQYLRLLAYRWECVEDGRVDWRRYVSALERHRTGDRGVLGINVHGSHLRFFAAALPHFSATTITYVWLQRRDKLGQAVSLAIAEQTRQWSSQFEKQQEATYDYEFFRMRLNMIQAHEAKIHAFLAKALPDRNTFYSDSIIYYEDVTRNPRATLEPLFGVSLEGVVAAGQSLQPQRNALNEQFVRRLAADMFRGPRT